ncbi:TonB-dependent receptor [Persicobacter psychrovividus]|uniref:TonB-dependent receptor n=1 Tax=Persicobacter psychrovividus TaxID=387638 RepID=A0ABM7VJP4_9BACT|nr:TonB-dependent receptor [Persicobacter psychrovividus]
MQKGLQLMLALMFMVLTSSMTYAQTILKGKILEDGTHDPVIGANVLLDHTTQGTITSIDGSFTLKTDKTGPQTVDVSFVGMETQQIPVTLNGTTQDLGTILLKGDAVGLQEVQVFASVATDRKTPVAVATIKAKALQEKLGTQEFPEVLKSTPGVYATKQGGGFGDSRISLRGFGSENIAVLINGMPVNDMENGRVYWSNWAGLSDVTRSMQVQRGLGASKLAIPSMGGTINILTQATDAKQGGSFFVGVGNDGFSKESVTLSTGQMDNGWAVSFSGAHTKGNGYVDATQFEGWSYFLNVSKQWTPNHMMSFNVFGASQEHGQRSTRLSLEDIYNNGRRYNADWGVYNGHVLNSKSNSYSKPVFSLNDYWTINDKLQLSTVLYASFGRGGGVAGYGKDAYFNNYRLPNSHIDFDALAQENNDAADGKPAGESTTIMANAINSHNWYGGVSTLTANLSPALTLTSGVDLRAYTGFHTKEVTDLMGGDYMIDRNFDVNDPNKIARVGDEVGFKNDSHVLWQSLFSQLEYSKDNLSAFVSGYGSNIMYKRKDYFNYTEGNQETDYVSFQTYGIKGGVNYNFNAHHNVFVNAGYLQRPPFMNAVFMNYKNDINKGAVNEKIITIEGGYGYRSAKFAGNANAYITKWQDKAMTRTLFGEAQDGGDLFANITGLSALHEGVEFDFEYRPSKLLTIKGSGSINNWYWIDDVNATFYDQNQQPVGGEKALSVKDLKVGNAAQTTGALGVRYEVLPKLRIGLEGTYFGNIYADYDPSKRDFDAEHPETADREQSWKMPNYFLLDFNVNYGFKIGKFDATIFGNLNNILDTDYIADARDGNDHNWQSALAYPTVGRTWSLGMKVKF